MNSPETELSRSYPDGRPHDEQPRWRQDFPTDSPDDEIVARREFTKFMVLTSGAFVAGQCWIGLASSLQSRQPLPEKKLIRAADLKPGEVAEFRYPTDADPCLLIRLADGWLVAYSQKCTHLSCAVIPDLKKGQFHCPCHNGAFEMEHGRPIMGPPRRPLPQIQIATREDGFLYAIGVKERTL
jgi:nitrite reductase/ring-hydroxylating ferredoxin subunit